MDNSVPIFLAQDQGFFKAEGLNVTILLVNSRAEAQQAVLNGTAHMSMGVNDAPITLNKAGAKVKTVMATSAITLNSIVVRKSIPVESGDIAGLKGLRLGVPGIGGGGDNMLRYWLKSAGLDPTKDVSIIAVGGGGGGLIAAMQANQVDGILGYEPFTSAIIGDLGIGKYAFDPTLGKGPPLTRPGNAIGNLVWTTSALASANKLAISRVVRAFSATLRFIKNDPAKAVDAAAKVFPELNKEKTLLPALQHMGKVVEPTIPRSGMSSLTEYLRIVGVLGPTESVKFEDYVFTEFEPDWGPPLNY